MIEREFVVEMINDFKKHWISLTALDEGMTIKETITAYGGEKLDLLHERISGKQVVMVENSYPVGNNDFFEKEDNNFVMHKSLFREI